MPLTGTIEVEAVIPTPDVWMMLNNRWAKSGGVLWLTKGETHSMWHQQDGTKKLIHPTCRSDDQAIVSTSDWDLTGVAAGDTRIEAVTRVAGSVTWVTWVTWVTVKVEP